MDGSAAIRAGNKRVYGNNKSRHYCDAMQVHFCEEAFTIVIVPFLGNLCDTNSANALNMELLAIKVHVPKITFSRHGPILDVWSRPGFNRLKLWFKPCLIKPVFTVV